MGITAKGTAAVQSAQATNKVDLAETMIRLKDGESVKVRLLHSDDYAEYLSVGDFALKVYTQPTRDDKDYFIEAGKLANSGAEGVGEEFKRLYAKKRYLIIMGDIATGKLRAWDCSKGQFNTFISALEEYKDIIDDNEELVFTFKRTGNKTDTVYSLQPAVRMKAEEKAGFHAFDETVIPDDFFNSLLLERSAEQQVQVLKDAGFPVEKYFPEIHLEETVATDAEPLDSI